MQCYDRGMNLKLYDIISGKSERCDMGVGSLKNVYGSSSAYWGKNDELKKGKIIIKFIQEQVCIQSTWEK